MPRRRLVDRMALELGVSTAWLLVEEARGGPRPDLKRERERYVADTGWRFREVSPDGGRDYGNANIHSFPWDIDTLVKESGQNSLDAARTPDDGIALRYRVRELTGQGLQEFLEALDWYGRNDGRAGLRSHVQAATENAQKAGAILREALRRLDDEDRMYLLTVEDYGTEGLTGPETGAGKFAALCRNNLDSNKSETAAGGSYGLGKAVFPKASGFGTVLFHSVPRDADEQETGTPARVFGRSDLAYHGVNGTEFSGPGWFGVDRNSRAESVWNNPALVRDLYLERDAGDLREGIPETGTSILVAGFTDPESEEQPRDISGIADAIADAVRRHFWPALLSGRLECTVEAWNNREQSKSIRVQPGPAEQPFVEAVSAYLNEETVEMLSDPGDVFEGRAELQIPATRPGSTIEQHHGVRHEPVLLIRASGDDEDETLRNRIAYYRGREMVVRYERLPVRGNARPYHAVVLCGEASGEPEAAIPGEQFLRIAEPPAHNEWTLTPELKALYTRGSGTSLKTFFSGVNQKVIETVRTVRRDLQEGPESLKELLRVAGDPPVKPKAPRLRILPGSGLDAAGRWDIRGEIKPPDQKGWTVAPSLIFAAETGGGRRAPWSLQAESGCEVSDGNLIVHAGVRNARFRGISDPEKHPAPATETSVNVVLQGARPLKGEGR